MTVKELIEQLQKANPEALVFLSEESFSGDSRKLKVVEINDDWRFRENVDEEFSIIHRHDDGWLPDEFDNLEPLVTLYPE